MFAWTSHGTELKRFAGHPITRAAVAVMLLIPLLYGAMYVWAFWDPTTHLNELPVALVNEDIPAADGDGTVHHYGADVVDELLDDDEIGWKQVDADDAAEGVNAGRYYFSVTIPADFSSRISSLGGDAPAAARIDVTYDDSNSFLASTLGRTAMLQMQTAVREKVSEEAVDTLLVGVGEARDGFNTASDGAFRLRDGLLDAEDGASRLSVGARQLADGAADLADGSGTLAAGAAKAAAGTRPLAEGVAQLDDGASQLATGLDTLSTSMPALTGGVTQLAQGSQAASTGAQHLQAGLSDYVAGVKQAADGAQSLAEGASQLGALQQGLAQAADARTGAPALAAGVHAMTSSVTTLATGAAQYADGAADVADGARELADGAESWRRQVYAATGGDGTDGTAQTNLVTATRHVAEGASQLSSATGTGSELGQAATGLAAGTEQLAGALDDVDTDYLALAQQALADGDVARATSSLDHARDAVQAAMRSADTLHGYAAGVKDGLLGDGGLHDNAAALSSGATSLSSAWRSINEAVAPTGGIGEGVTSLSDGADDLTAAAGGLQAGARELADPSTLNQARQLAAGADALSSALTTMSAGASDETSGIPALQSGAARLSGAFTSADPARPGLVLGAQQLEAGASDLSTGLDTLAAGARTAATGTGQLADGVVALDTGAQTLRAGTHALDAKVPALAAGVKKLDAGAHELADGARKLDDGTRELASRAPALASGLTQARKGEGTLAHKLADGAQDIPDDDHARRTDRAQAVSTPVSVESTHVWEADSWGEGFAPFFISLALWVGALITWLLLRALQTRALMTSVSGFRMAWGSLNSALLLSIGQVVIMLGVMHFAIGLNPKNVLATVLFSLLTAAAFFALQQFFQVTFGSAVGKVVIIVLLMVQLASAGGTYPIQTTPSFLQAINPYMPMTYVVNGLRESITGGIETRFWVSVAVLAGIFVVSLAATSIAAARKRMWTMSRLHPALSI